MSENEGPGHWPEGAPAWKADLLGRTFVVKTPSPLALDRHDSFLVGCMECDYVTAVTHECAPDCLPHPRVETPTALRILPHWAHG